MRQVINTILLFGMITTGVHAQNAEPVTLEYCYERIRTEYPIAEKLELQDRITALNVQLRQTGLYPEISLNGSASYQSDVTEVGFAGPAAPDFSKDHYSIGVDVTQPLYDGGRTGSLKEAARKAGEVAKAVVEVDLHTVRRQVDQVYFGVLLLQKQSSTIAILKEDLQEQLRSVQSMVENGMILPGNALTLQAELLKVEQQQAETQANIEAAYELLSQLIGEEVSRERGVAVPEVVPDYNSAGDYKRPEFEVFRNKEEELKARVGTIHSAKLPVLSAFAKTAYARPGLNAFNDDMQLYWIVGVKAQWSFRNWRNADKQKQVVMVQQAQLQAEEDAFTRQLEASIHETESRIQSLNEKIRLDEQVLNLREQVVQEKQNLLDEGAITSTEYITELNAASRARLNMEIHKVQLVQARYEYLTKRGISWN